ncbi:MAG: 16S rRNA (guanine(527)-N(7))-methyltransferase RsmG [Gammaproteobacteria bacterium]|nr:16S rRNA (guanine(527)-N(7))-methyltransferase RsmG [Gammaproteobacteria bacterium]
MPADTSDQLIADAARIEVALTGTMAARLQDYLRLLGEWSRAYNLTAVTDPQEQISYHLLDSLSVLRHVKGTRVADAGTGAGLPGIVLAIADPDRHYTLIDATAKKTRFLRHVVRTLSLENIEIVTSRLEDYRPQTGFDTVVARALAPLPKLLELTGSLLADNGRLLAMKGRDPIGEIQGLTGAWTMRDKLKLEVPGLRADRHLVVITK